MHPNEIVINEKNVVGLQNDALQLSKSHIEALAEQLRRQKPDLSPIS